MHFKTDTTFFFSFDFILIGIIVIISFKGPIFSRLAVVYASMLAACTWSLVHMNVCIKYTWHKVPLGFTQEAEQFAAQFPFKTLAYMCIFVRNR